MNRIRCPVCHKPGPYCFDHRRCRHNMSTTYGPRGPVPTVRCHTCHDDHRIDEECPKGARNTYTPPLDLGPWDARTPYPYACPDIDQGMDDSDMVFAEETPLPTDMINHPPHYNQCGIEAIDVIEAYAAGNYHRGAALKYLLRADYKGAKMEDLRKAIWYIEREIDKSTFT